MRDLRKGESMSQQNRCVLFLFVLCLYAFGEPPRKCRYYDSGTSQLAVRDGYLDFISPEKLQPFKKRLPKLSDGEMNGLLHSPDTIWYDEHSMVFLYQDSIEVVTGGRANCVARMIGEEHQDNPGIAKLMEYFGADYKFLFPFRTAAGTDEVTNVHVKNFWVPPTKNGKRLPVKWWKISSRGRWRWAFPKGTVFGEILYEKGPNQEWYPFEVRIRRRYLDGWDVGVFRPFRTAEELSEAIKQRRPGWEENANLRSVVSHLLNRAALTPSKMVSKAYGKVFPPIEGALDVIPEIQDSYLTIELLTQIPFQSTEGAVWKENGALKTFAPGSAANFSIVPKDYQMGLIPVNEVSCKRCHSETGRRLNDFDFQIQLYGEVWGEDQIFTWHLFEPHDKIFGPWDEHDGSRKINQRLVRANLVENQKPAVGDADYKPLPTAFVPETFKNRFEELYQK